MSPVGEALKVVVRLLPPEITEDEFKNTVPPVHQEKAKWWKFVAGKRYKGEAKPSLNARCYISFETSAHAEEFVGQYHGHQFVDGQGESFRAVATTAPYQKVPRKAQKDPRDGTIEDDAAYKDFVEKLQQKKEYEPPVDPRGLIRPAEGEDTPLVQYMKQRAADRKARWEKRQSKWAAWKAMESVPEEWEGGKRPKWYCSECYTTKHLEEDPDARGTFYCSYCWDSWETQETAKAKKKKKKYKEEEAWEEEDTGKKKKKKKHEKEVGEWRPKHSSKEWAEADDEVQEEKPKKKKKKKDKEAEAWGEEEPKRKWKAKKADDWGEDWGDEWKAGGGTSSGHKKKSSKHRDTEADWWGEESRGSKADRYSRAEETGGRRWKAKAPAESASAGGGGEEEKPSRKGRKEKESESSDSWRPKSSSWGYR